MHTLVALTFLQPAAAAPAACAPAMPGEVIWSRDLGAPVYSSAAIDGNDLFIATFTDRARASSLSRLTGALQWERDVVGGVENAAVYRDGVLYLNTVLLAPYLNAVDDNGLPEIIDGIPAYMFEGPVALDAATGAVLWAGESIAGTDSSPTIDTRNKQLITGVVYNHLLPEHMRRGKKIYAYDLDSGEINWELDIDGWSYCSYAMSASDDVIYAGWEDTGGDGVAFDGSSGLGRFAAIDTTTGTVLWEVRSDAPFSRAPAVYKRLRFGDRIYAGTQQGRILALDKDGDTLWENNLDVDGFTGLILGEDNAHLYLTTGFGDLSYAYRLLSLSAYTGEVEWDLEVLGGNTPTAGDAAIYVVSGEGVFYSVSTAGEVNWQLNLGEPVAQQTGVVLDECGVAYVGTEDGTLFAIQTESSGTDPSSEWARYRGDGSGNPDR